MQSETEYFRRVYETTYEDMLRYAGHIDKKATIMLNVTGGGEKEFMEGKNIWYKKPDAIFPLDAEADAVIEKAEALFA